jgi:DNA-binding protein HU-beta
MSPVNKRDLAKAVAVQSDVDLATVSKVLDGFTDVVTGVVAKGEPITMTGFAKFVKVERAARMGRNPATGEQIRIKASKRARITPAKTFKDAVLSARGPKLARGVWPLDADAVKRAGHNGVAKSTTKSTTKRLPAASSPARTATRTRSVPRTAKRT